MVATLNYNPYLVTYANNGMFGVHSMGLKQGTAYPDPAIRNQLRGGWLSASDTLPMWGGVGIYMQVPGAAGNPNVAFQTQMGRATSIAGGSKPLLGFSVFDQNYSMVTTPGNTVPIAVANQSVHAYALGSRARIAVQCDPLLIGLAGTPINSQVAWDLQNQILVPYIAAALTASSGTYNSTTGLITLTMSAPITFSPGASVVTSALTGTGAFASLNGTWTSVSPSTGTTLTLQGPVGAGAATITGGTVTPSSGVGASSAIAVDILEVQTTNCITVAWDPINLVANWNFNGCCAVIQI
jgi:hypothetical protein